MDFEDYLVTTYTPLKAIECFSNIIYTKINEDWELFSDDGSRSDFEELLAINFGIKLCARYLLTRRNHELESIDTN